MFSYSEHPLTPCAPLNIGYLLHHDLVHGLVCPGDAAAAGAVDQTRVRLNSFADVLNIAAITSDSPCTN